MTTKRKRDSCVRETITGGTVIGADASDVRSGEVSWVNIQRKPSSPAR